MKTQRRVSLFRGAFAVYLMTGVLCFLPALVMNDLFGYFLPGVFLFASLLSAGVCRWQSGRIRCTFQGGEKTCRRKESMEFSVLLENAAILPCIGCEMTLKIEGEDGMPVAENQAFFSLRPRERRSFRFDVRFEHLGIYRVRMEAIRVHSMMGVLAFSMQGSSETGAVTVSPGFYVLEEMELSDQIYTESRQARMKSGAESVESAGVREYAYGDPIKLIHWKLSSHAGEYVTRVLESYGNHALTVILSGWILPETEYHRPDLCDAVLESCASLCRQAMEEGVETRIRFVERNGSRAEYLPEQGDDYAVFLDEMEPFSSKEAMRSIVAEALEQEASSLYTSNHVAICAAALGEEMVEATLQLATSGRDVRLFFCVDGQDESRVERQIRTLEAGGVICYPFERPEALGRKVGG